MLDRLRHARLSAFALAFYALATLAVSFSHKPIALAGPDPALTALALQDDAPLSLCDHDGGAPIHQQAGDRVCDACALTSAPGLPPADECALPAPRGRKLALSFNAEGQFAPPALHAPLSRGPPAA
ncbi:MAG: hypothetical protein KDJ25_11430 [Rhodoblastus sp.]|nr:hypothetical protein [Rhodoblastus sp.]